MRKPLIGITTRNLFYGPLEIAGAASPKSYLDAISNAGGVPVMVPVNLPIQDLDEVLDRLDGLVFTGGADIDPKKFNGNMHKKVYGLDPQRDSVEFELFDLIEERKMPFLGICRGFQIVNVAKGGTLYTHISDQKEASLDHAHQKGNPFDHINHKVSVAPEGLLAKIVSRSEMNVNSLHHQGAEKIGEGLTPVAWAEDGLVEGLELQGHPFGLALQWHPEWMPKDDVQQGIFREFVRACNGQ